MYTQNTPVHVKLWHHDFWRLALANLLITMSVYMFIPVLPAWMSAYVGADVSRYAMGVYAIGLFVLGGFCSYLVQRYRRNHVCVISILTMVASSVCLYYLPGLLGNNQSLLPALFITVRFVLGAAFGLAQMVLMSTLVIDTSESFQRTEANHSAAWFGRFSLSLGPLASLLIHHYLGFQEVIWASCACGLVAIVLIQLVDFPFKAPEDGIRVFSTDRFFLVHGSPLFLNLMLCTMVVGIIMTIENEVIFYGMMMAGFLLALLSQRFVFANAELKSEIVSGLVLLCASVLMLMTDNQTAINYIIPVFVGLAIGVIGARFLLFFIKLSKHCQRGTSQSSYFLAWELGLTAGIFIGLGYGDGQKTALLHIALIITVLALLMYQVFTHSWYLKNKNR
ncbi:MAG: MFS transporter [Prevotella sp.]|nr:MFS transporter [Prevotella sp.]MBR1462435.1 MFS transporter [Prevotella sp.]